MFKILVERFTSSFALATVLEFSTYDDADEAYDNLKQTKPGSGSGIVTIITKLY